MEVSSLIREIRLYNNYSQEEFADLLGCTREHISHLENGKYGCTIKFLTNIEEKCNLRITTTFENRLYRNA